ncbi:hypothetical protein MCOR31_010870, partial [Pyricularia oryzae]
TPILLSTFTLSMAWATKAPFTLFPCPRISRGSSQRPPAAAVTMFAAAVRTGMRPRSPKSVDVLMGTFIWYLGLARAP